MVNVAVDNEPPLCTAAALSTAPGQPVSGRLICQDESTFAITVLSNGANGTAVVQPDGTFTYTPNAGFIGSDAFSFVASDGSLTSAPAQLSIAVGTVTIPCADDVQCNTDACAPGTCVQHQCTQTTLPGFAGADCQLGRLLAADVCGDELVDKKLGKAIGKTVGNVRGILTKAAGASGKKQAKLVRKAGKKLAALGKKAGKAKKTPATCRSTLTGLIASQRQLVLALAPQ